MKPDQADQSSSLVQTQIHDLALPSMEAALQHILGLGIEAAPEEACGLLVNEIHGVRVVPMANRAENPVNGYRIDPVTVRQLALKHKQWSHVAVWHTHPGGLVGPSAGDLEHKLNNVNYLVVTIPTGEFVWF